MKQNMDFLLNVYNLVQDTWIESCRPGKAGVGRTFEKLIGKAEENYECPDYYDIEIKTCRKFNKAGISLFSYTPKGNKPFQTKRLFNNFGYMCNGGKVLNVSLYLNKSIVVNNRFVFSLKFEDNKFFLIIKDMFGDFIEKECFWDIKDIQMKLRRKMKYLVMIEADSKFYNGKEYFKYSNITFYSLKEDFAFFMDAFKKGHIRISLKLGTYKSGEKKGQFHDHGTSFDINRKYLTSIFSVIEMN